MPVTQTAKKALQRSIKLRARNLVFKKAMKKAIKDMKEAAQSSMKADELQKLGNIAYSAIDKAKRRNIVHKNNAARKKSFIARLIGNAS